MKSKFSVVRKEGDLVILRLEGDEETPNEALVMSPETARRLADDLYAKAGRELPPLQSSKK